MPKLTDRQRIELAVPAYLFYVLSSAPNVFNPASPTLEAQAQADVAQLCGDLKTACLEPFSDLTPTKRQSLMRRLERLKKQLTADWEQHQALSLMLMLWCFLKDLIDREVLVLWEGSAMDRATQQLLPMFEHGFDAHESAMAANQQAKRLLARLQADGLYI